MLEIADLSRTIMGLGVVLLLIVVVLWLVRRFGPQGVVGGTPAGRRLALLESLAIDPRTRLVLVRHDGREHLLVVSASGGASVVSSGDDSSVSARPAPAAAGIDSRAVGRGT